MGLPFVCARFVRCIVAALAMAGSAASALAAAEDAQTQIAVSRAGETFVVDARLFAPVPAREAWAVLVDFDRMASFVPNLVESRVASRSDNQLLVMQKGVARFGVLRYPFESVREVELTPFDTVRSHNVGGNVTKVDSVTRLEPADGGTVIRYHVELVPGFWFPGAVGEAFIRHEIREQFEAIVREMVRRQRAASGA
jgi:hypothetical protein